MGLSQVARAPRPEAEHGRLFEPHGAETRLSPAHGASARFRWTAPRRRVDGALDHGTHGSASAGGTKVWYEHEEGLSSEGAVGALEQLVSRSLTLKEGRGVRVHSYEVGNAALPPGRPEPDF